jgi:WD40 repeat protein
MPVRTRRDARDIVPSQTRSLTLLSTPLVMRGLREFPQSSHWSTRQVFNEPRKNFKISPLGYVASYSPEPRESSQRIEIADLEMRGVPQSISVPNESPEARLDSLASFGWSPAGTLLVAASAAWRPILHLIDTRRGQFLGAFGDFQVLPTEIVWSDSGHYFASAASGSQSAVFQLWLAGESAQQFNLICSLDRTIAVDDPAGLDLGDQGQFFGFGATAFRPGEKSLATVLEFEGDWSDDLILMTRVPSLEKMATYEATGHVTSLSWSADGKYLYFCASGQTYSLDVNSGTVTSLPFAAELCRCHPSLPLCAFFNSWKKSSAKGRIFIADLQRIKLVDECWAEGILGLRWSQDGYTLYAVSQDGTAYLFERTPA